MNIASNPIVLLNGFRLYAWKDKHDGMHKASCDHCSWRGCPALIDIMAVETNGFNLLMEVTRASKKRDYSNEGRLWERNSRKNCFEFEFEISQQKEH